MYTIDVTKLANIRIGQTVKIKSINNTNENSVGKIYEVVSKNDDLQGIIALLVNGDTGHIDQVLNSPEIIKERILSETQNFAKKSEDLTQNIQNSLGSTS